jgi:hypothetical protein
VVGSDAITSRASMVSLYAASTGLLWGVVSAFVFDEDLGRAAASAVFFGVLFATIGVWREMHPLCRRRPPRGH